MDKVLPIVMPGDVAYSFALCFLNWPSGRGVLLEIIFNRKKRNYSVIKKMNSFLGSPHQWVKVKWVKVSVGVVPRCSARCPRVRVRLGSWGLVLFLHVEARICRASWWFSSYGVLLLCTRRLLWFPAADNFVQWFRDAKKLPCAYISTKFEEFHWGKVIRVPT